MTPVTVSMGESPVIMTMPHAGTFLPDDIRSNLNEIGLSVKDTDWHIPKLYEGLLPSATRVIANFSRYVIDANRAPDDVSLYPGQNTTGLCPTKSFDDENIYKTGREPDESEISERLDQFHRPYHGAIEQEIDRIKDLHGLAIIFECHSIRGNVPYLFQGQLPDLNIGTYNSQSCEMRFESSVANALKVSNAYSHVLNGRFKGGWTTRHYGKPSQNVHAIQMEIVQGNYMTEFPPWTYLAEKAESLRSLLGIILNNLDDIARHNGI